MIFNYFISLTSHNISWIVKMSQSHTGKQAHRSEGEVQKEHMFETSNSEFFKLF